MKIENIEQLEKMFTKYLEEEYAKSPHQFLAKIVLDGFLHWLKTKLI